MSDEWDDWDEDDPRIWSDNDADLEEIVPFCDLENPTSCESCQ